jgi:hypothetical protein
MVLGSVKAEGVTKRVNQLADPPRAVNGHGSTVHRTAELEKMGSSLLKVGD